MLNRAIKENRHKVSIPVRKDRSEVKPRPLSFPISVDRVAIMEAVAMETLINDRAIYEELAKV